MYRLRCTPHVSDQWCFFQAFSYALGPLEESALLQMCMHLDGEDVDLLVPGPVWLPLALLAHPDFRDGCEAGFFCSGDEFSGTPASLVNEVFRNFTGGMISEDVEGPHPSCEVYPWNVGFLIGDLSWLASRHRLLARVGLAHLCFLLRVLPGLPRPQMLSEARSLHNEAVKAYRLRVRAYKQLGMSVKEARWLALVDPPLVSLDAGCQLPDDGRVQVTLSAWLADRV